MNQLIGPTPAEVSVYQGYLVDWSQGAAYRDWWFEYPPGLLMLAKIPTLFTQNPEMYFVAWLVMIIACALLTHLFLGRKAIWVTAMALAGGLLTTHRFDIFVVFIVAWALQANRRHHTFIAAMLLTFGVFLKIYPIIPLMLLFLFRERKHFLSMAIGTLVVAVPMLIWWAPGIPRFLEFHGAKHVQIESAVIPKNHGPVVYEKFSWVHEETDADRTAQAITIAVGLVGIAFLRLTSRKHYELASYVGVLSFILSGNIFSPQYMLWLASFLPFLGQGIALATIGLTWMTKFYFENFYQQIIDQTKPELSLLIWRNELLFFIQRLLSGWSIGCYFQKRSLTQE